MSERAAEAVVLRSTLHCSRCGADTEAEMPANACQIFYSCPACGEVLRPEPGDCCVFCSYGATPCPPVQAAAHRGAGDLA